MYLLEPMCQRKMFKFVLCILMDNTDLFYLILFTMQCVGKKVDQKMLKHSSHRMVITVEHCQTYQNMRAETCPTDSGDGEDVRPCGEPPAYSGIRPSYRTDFLSEPATILCFFTSNLDFLTQLLTCDPTMNKF